MPRMDRNETEPTVIQPAEGRHAELGALGVVWKIDGEESDRRFSVVEHSIARRSLAAPLHLHCKEDEYSYVVEGTLGALLGDETVLATAGSWVFKPRDKWHTCWSADDTPCRVVEIIAPAGFEGYYREIAEVYNGAADGVPIDLNHFAQVNARYEIEMDFDSTGPLCERFGLTHPFA
jgi:quercetin dioxygenase-like cupin family protein